MKHNTKIAAAVFVAIPVAILAAAIACTWAVAHGASERWRLVFRLLCHGIPERCFILWGVPMPICARCTAIYCGLLAGLLLFFVMPWIEERLARVMMYLSAGVLAIDGVTQALRLRESTNGLRTVTGLAAGVTFGIWVLAAIERREKRAFSTS